MAWTYREVGQWLEGGSHVDGTCLYLDRYFGLAVRFAVWYHRLVPPSEELILCDDSYSFDVPVPAPAGPLHLDDLRSWCVRQKPRGWTRPCSSPAGTSSAPSCVSTGPSGSVS